MAAHGEAARIAIIGAGAIGGMLAYALAAAGREVTMCLRSPLDRLTVEIGGATHEVGARFATDPAEIGVADWVFLTTKAQDTAAAAPWFSRLCGPDTMSVAAQNGVDHRERLAPVVPQGTIVPAIVYCSAERTRPGAIRHHRSTRLEVADDEPGRALAALMAGTIFTVDLSADLTTAAWRKLLGNVVANPITALTLRRQAVLADPAIAPLARALIEEAAAAGRAAGADLPDDHVERELASLTASNRARGAGGSSMLYDRLASLPTEHEHITGAVVAAAERHGIDVPASRTVLALCRAASGRPLDGSD